MDAFIEYEWMKMVKMFKNLKRKQDIVVEEYSPIIGK